MSGQATPESVFDYVVVGAGSAGSAVASRLRPHLDRAAFERLLGELRPKLHRYCARMTGSVIDGEDVVQDALDLRNRMAGTLCPGLKLLALIGGILTIGGNPHVNCAALRLAKASFAALRMGRLRHSFLYGRERGRLWPSAATRAGVTKRLQQPRPKRLWPLRKLRRRWSGRLTRLWPRMPQARSFRGRLPPRRSISPAQSGRFFAPGAQVPAGSKRIVVCPP
jgi:hypothetical protein